MPAVLRTSQLTFLLLSLSLAHAASVLADNGPEQAQRRAQEDIVPKVAAACAVPLTLRYDADSLRKYNQDIRDDQTGGESACNEPLRYLWYVCKTDAGKAAVKAARIATIVCRGTAAKTGSLTLAGGTLTVERAFEESRAYERARANFESQLKISLKIGKNGPADPYYDEAWHQLAQQPNPVTSTSDYCLVDGEKRAFDANLFDLYVRRKEDASVKCWKAAELVIDLSIRGGQKTGFVTELHDRQTRRVSYRDNKQHGEERRLDNGVLKSLALYESGERVWQKEFFPDGRLAGYSHKYPDGLAELRRAANGRISQLRCTPSVGGDEHLHVLCGFNVPTTTSIYDGTEKVNRVETWKDGVLQKLGPGTSAYAERSEVAFQDGKKHGEERVFRADGTLATSIVWDGGVQAGPERTYAADGTKIVKETLWAGGEPKRVTEFFLNGNPKLSEVYESPTHQQRTTFWDTGNISQQGRFVLCETSRYGTTSRDWCEEGMQRALFENGTVQAEQTFLHGKRHGVSKTWWENGKPQSVEEFREDERTKSRRWDQEGKLIADEEFEADGSRKVKR